MKTVLKNIKEVAHIWAQQNQSLGRSGNLFFDGPSIYSYGLHFCIATFVKPNVVLLTTKTYSVSTAKHIGYVHSAIGGHIKTFNVPALGLSDRAHKTNLEFYKNMREDCLSKALRAVKDTAWLINQAKMYNGQALDYCHEFGLIKKYSKPFQDVLFITEALQAKVDKQEFNRIHAEEIKAQKDRIFQSELYNLVLPVWLRHGVDYPEGYSIHSLSKLSNSFLRVSNDGQCIETTQGATVTLKEGHLLYKAIQQKKDIHGWQIGSYTVIGINGVLTIGCHTIERSEIERFAIAQGWN